MLWVATREILQICSKSSKSLLTQLIFVRFVKICKISVRRTSLCLIVFSFYSGRGTPRPYARLIFHIKRTTVVSAFWLHLFCIPNSSQESSTEVMEVKVLERLYWIIKICRLREDTCFWLMIFDGYAVRCLWCVGCDYMMVGWVRKEERWWKDNRFGAIKVSAGKEWWTRKTKIEKKSPWVAGKIVYLDFEKAN